MDTLGAPLADGRINVQFSAVLKRQQQSLGFRCFRYRLIPANALDTRWFGEFRFLKMQNGGITHYDRNKQRPPQARLLSRGRIGMRKHFRRLFQKNFDIHACCLLYCSSSFSVLLQRM